MQHPSVVLKATGVTKSFGGVQALKGVSFELRAGEVHGLIGENGAGKSTLVKIISGAVTPDGGELEVNGQPVEANDPVAARRLGVAAIYQQPALFPDLSVAENIAIGLESSGPWRWIDWNAWRRRAAELLSRIGAPIHPDADVRSLSMPQQQLVEIARALGADARILIMDEPTSSLGEREVEHLFGVIRQLRSQGVGIIYVSHRLEELATIADRVTALRDGALVGTRTMSDVSRGESDPHDGRPGTIGRVSKDGDRCGRRAARSAAVELPRDGRPQRLVRRPRRRNLRACGTRRRGANGIGPRAVRHHAGRWRRDSVGRPNGGDPLPGRCGGTWHRLRSRRSPSARRDPRDAGGRQCDARDLASEFRQPACSIRRRNGRLPDRSSSGWGSKPPRSIRRSRNLSGGNQQKVSLARWLAAKPRVLILDEPTQGIDVGAKAEIHRLMGELAGQGLAIIMISSEMPEILGMSDRIGVMCGGRLVATLDRRRGDARSFARPGPRACRRSDRRMRHLLSHSGAAGTCASVGGGGLFGSLGDAVLRRAAGFLFDGPILEDARLFRADRSSRRSA